MENEGPSIIDLPSENLQRFMDLCYQLVDNYQNGILVERKHKSGQNNKWRRPAYPRYESNHIVDPQVKEACDDQEFCQKTDFPI